MEGFLPEFNYESIQKLITKQKEDQALVIKQQVEQTLTMIYEDVKDSIIKGYTSVSFNLPNEMDINIRSMIVDELCVRFPKRVLFWFEFEKKYVLLHEHHCNPPIVRNYKIEF